MLRSLAHTKTLQYLLTATRQAAAQPSQLLHHYSALTTLVHERKDNVDVFTLNRPKLNLINSVLTQELLSVLRSNDSDADIAATVITGQGHVFSAGADVKEMSGWMSDGKASDCTIGQWRDFGEIQKPVIAAVNGAALGGGAELAMMCDVIIASENASFGQPEVKLGIIPGMGATQRLIRAVGKSKAMEMILTGEPLSVGEAWKRGLVSKVVKHEEVVKEGVELGRKISSLPGSIVVKAKYCVNHACVGLDGGLDEEYKEFLSCLDMEESKEGVFAFIEKRLPAWKKG